MKTFNEVVNTATTKSGQLKSGLALTKLAQDDTLSVTFNGNIFVNDIELEVGAVIAAALLPAYDDKYQQSLTDTLNLYSEGYVLPTQKNIALAIAAGGASVKKLSPLDNAKRSLTSEEYKNNCLRLNQIDNAVLYEEIEVILQDSKVTKQQLLDFVAGIALKLFTTEQNDTFEVMANAEKLAALEFEALTVAGFSDIKRLADNSTIQATVKTELAASAVPQLTTCGYLLIGTVFDAATMSIKVSFKKAVQETIVE